MSRARTNFWGRKPKEYVPPTMGRMDLAAAARRVAGSVKASRNTYFLVQGKPGRSNLWYLVPSLRDRSFELASGFSVPVGIIKSTDPWRTVVGTLSQARNPEVYSVIFVDPYNGTVSGPFSYDKMLQDVQAHAAANPKRWTLGELMALPPRQVTDLLVRGEITAEQAAQLVQRRPGAVRRKSRKLTAAEQDHEERVEELVMASEAFAKALGRKGGHQFAEANPRARQNLATATVVALQLVGPIAARLGKEKWAELMAMDVQSRARWLEQASKKMSWVGPMGPVGRLSFNFGPRKKMRRKLLIAVSKAMTSPDVQAVAQQAGSMAFEAATSKSGGNMEKLAANNPPKFGSRPAPGHAEEAIRRKGYDNIKYTGGDWERGSGPVLTFTGTKSGVRYLLWAGRLQGTDTVVVARKGRA